MIFCFLTTIAITYYSQNESGYEMTTDESISNVTSYQIVCRPCRTENNICDVSHFCDECQEYLCTACGQQHGMLQLTKGHKLSRYRMGKRSLRQYHLRTECACGKNEPISFICVKHNDAVCVICKHSKHRTCTTHSVCFRERNDDDSKRTAINNDLMKKHSLRSKADSRRKRTTTGLPASTKKKRTYTPEPKRNSKRKCAHKIPDKTKHDNLTPDINDKDPEANEPGQIIFSPYAIQTPAGSSDTKQVRFIRSVNIRVGPPPIGDYTGNWVSSICFMPNGCPVLTEFSNATVKVLDADTFEIKGFTKLVGALVDVAVIGDDSVITTLCFYKRLQYVQVFPEILPGRCIQLQNECYGVDVLGDEIFVAVTATWWTSGGEIKVLDLNGNLKRSIEISPDVHMLRWPRSLRINKPEGTIFVSDHYDSTLLVMTRKGDVLFKYNDVELKGLYGLCLDQDSNVYACGDDSRNVQLISKTGSKIATPLDLNKIVGLREPHSIAVRGSDDTILIGGRHTEHLYIFKVTELIQ